MLRYRTEVFIPPDRLITLQLPDHFPEGRAVVTVQFLDVHEPVDQPESLDEDGDMEWWEEFDGQAGRID